MAFWDSFQADCMKQLPRQMNYIKHTQSAENFHIFLNWLTLVGTSLQGPSPSGKAAAGWCAPPVYVLSLQRHSAQDRNQCPAVKRREVNKGGRKILADATFFSTLFQYTHQTSELF